MRRFLQSLLSLVIMTGLVSAARGAETVIRDDAILTFDTAIGPGVITSNLVVLIYDRSVSYDLQQENSVDSLRGTEPALPHRVVNTGERALQLSFEIGNDMKSRESGATDFMINNLALYVDANNNGRIDDNEQALTADSVVPIAPQEQLHLLVRGRVPMSARSGGKAKVSIRARENIYAMTTNRTDSVRVVELQGPGLLVEKTASRSEAEVGETITYTVRVRNVAGLEVDNVAMLDRLPVGFVFIAGSVELDGKKALDATAVGTELRFPIGHLENNAVSTITYRARIGPAALSGNGINEARATAPSVTSNTAKAKVAVRDGVFTDKGILLGRVFIDANGNHQPDAGELGIPGARLYLEDGTSVVTDADGKYSFYGLLPNTHTLKLDATSLPYGARPLLTSTHQAGVADSYIVDLKRYEMRRVDFALVAPPEGIEQAKLRRAALRAPAEIDRELQGRLTPDGRPIELADPKARAASGVVTAPVETALTPVVAPNGASAKPIFKLEIHPQADASAPVSASALSANDDALLGAITDNTPAFVGLTDGAVLPSAQTEVMVKGPLGAQFSLSVNGTVIGDDRVGTKASMPDLKTELWKFIGLNLVPGDNRLQLTVRDPFGNVRAEQSIQVRAPGALAKIKITTHDSIADGASLSPLVIELVDQLGTPVTARTPISLSLTTGALLVDDLDPSEPGAQVFIEGGKRSFSIEAPLDPATCTVLVSSGEIAADASFAFKPNLRPMIATGIVEGSLNFGTRARGALFPVDSKDAFENELRGLSRTSSNGKLGAGGRAALFLKGKVRGDFLLTASYDSDKPSNMRLFRDIQPGEFYPVYGDASVRSYDAQSTGKLYVRIDRNRSYALIGDFTTAPQVAGPADNIRSLGTYQRSLNGAKEHFENDRVRANAWASQDTLTQVVLEVPANGTSGPFDLALSNAVVNSERVEILTRDRDQPSRVLKVQPMGRFTDYEFEAFTGRLLFKAPISSLDSDLNPQSIRVTAEVDQGGGKFWVYGVDGVVKVNSRLDVAAGYARDENPANLYQLASVGAALKIAAPTTLTAEIAASDSEKDGRGTAGRVEVKHQTAKTDATAYYGQTAPEFRNAGALLLPGRRESGFRVAQKLTPDTSLVAQGILSEDMATGGRRLGATADVEHAIGAYKVAAGVRHSEETDTPASENTTGTTPNTVDSVRLKAAGPIPNFSRVIGVLEYEQDVRDAELRRAMAGFDYALLGGGRAYARHEFISSLGGGFELNDQQRNRTTLVGLERKFFGDGRIFNEYRSSNEITGREAEAALGLKNLWRIAPGVNGSTSFERVTPVSGVVRNESTAITGAIDYARDPRWRANTRLELRSSTTADSLLHSVGYARQIDRDWTFLGKSIMLITRYNGANGGNTTQARAQAGVAWRPENNLKWNGLAKYELKYESDSRSAATVSQRVAHVVAGDLNYQPDPMWSFNFHYAGKWVQETYLNEQQDYIAHLVAVRIARQLNRRFDVALNLSGLADGSFDQVRYAVGPEFGVLLGKNFNCGVGYNVVGFSDRDLAADGGASRGFYFRFRVKIDESLVPAAVTGAEKPKDLATQ